MTTAFEREVRAYWRQSTSAMRETACNEMGARNIARLMRNAADEPSNRTSLRVAMDSSARAVFGRINAVKIYDSNEPEPMAITAADEHYINAMIATVEELGMRRTDDAELIRRRLIGAGFHTEVVDRCINRVVKFNIRKIENGT